MFGSTGFGGGNTGGFGAQQSTFGNAASSGGFGAQASNTGGFGGSTFGQPANNTGGFGQASTGGFGSNTQQQGGFGATGAFGGQQKQSSPFGQQTNTGGFGQSNAGGFGQATTGGFGQASTGGFGGAPSAFGAAPTNNAFGASSNNAFGASTTNTGGFGQATTGAGGFGQQSSPFGAAPATSAFGAAPATSAFGAAPATSAFGAAPATSAFGASPGSSTFGAATSPFGATNTASSSFGANNSAGGFGSTANTQLGGFGSPQNNLGGGAGTGPGSTPYQPVVSNENNTKVSILAITASPAYASKSFEELRFEDYERGNKGGQQQQAPGGFGSSTFGAAPAPSAFGAGGFGATPAPSAFGAAPAPSAFGAAPAPSAFGAGGFGATSPAPAPSAFGGFGATPAAAPAPSAFGGFGATPAAAPAPSAFGGFGSPAPAPAPSAFGGFGSPAAAPAPSAFGGFGAASPAPAPSAFGGFGAASPAPAPSAFGGFGSPAPAPALGGFGAAPAAPSAFGAFGSPAAAAPAPSAFGSFGTPAAAPAPSAFGGFGAAAPATNAATLTNLPNQILVSDGTNITSDAALASKLAFLESQRQSLALTASPSQPYLPPNTAASNKPPNASTYPTASANTLRSFQSGGSTAKIRPRLSGLSPVPKSTPLNPSNTPNKNLLLSPDAYLGNSTKRLVIKDGALTPKLKMRLQLTNGSHDGANGTPASKTPQAKNNPQPTPPTNSSLNYDGQSPIHPDNSSVQFDIPAETPHSMAGNSTPGTNGSSSMAQTSTKKTPPSSHKSNTSVDFYNQVVSSPSASTPVQNPAYMPRLLNSDYITSPPFSEIMSMGEVELATVKDFTMIHPSRGSIQWQGTVDIRGVDLDATVIIGDKEVAVYDDEDVQNKPEVGEKLNRPAIVTLYNITPTNDMAKFTKKLERVTKKMDAEFISYDPDEEVWCFRTKHFSRYGLGDDSDDEEDGVDTQAGGAVEKKTSVVASFQPAPPKPPSSVPLIKGLDFRSGDRGGRSPGPKLSPFVPTRRNFGDAVEDEDEVMDKANDAYGMILDEFMDVDGRTVTPVLEGSAGAEVSEAEERQWSKSKPYKPPLWKVKDVTPRGQGGICGRIRKEEGVSDKNVRDFQHFMGRGCRASFGPDGKLVTTGKDGRTVFIQAPAACAGEGRGDMFRVHSRHSLAEGEGEEALPMFRLPSGLANKGTSESYVSLLRCLDAYIDAFDGRPGGKSDVGRMGFVLVRALYGQEDAAYDATNPADLLPILPLDLNKVDVDRRAEGFKAFLREFVAEDVDALVKQNRDRKPATAILAALLGDKTEEAIELAIENGYSRLATLLCSGFSCAEYMVEQLGSWADGLAKLDGELLRVYNLLAGKVSENEGLLYERGSRQIGWRIRLAAHMLCGLCGYGGERKTVIDAVGDYDSEVMRKTAPQPFPRWDEARRGDNGRKCLVYNLLRMYVSGGGRDGSSDSKLGEVLHPHGYSKNENDFSLGWHVGAILVSLGVTSRMSGEEALKFCSSYADDLVRNGEWEKAVYVLLCTKNFVREEEEEKTAEGARRMAEDVIMRNYGDGARGEGGRKWLEELGVKGKVFEEAIALAKGWKGDCIGLCKAAVNAGNIGLAVKNINLCKPLFVGGEDEANLHTLLGYLKEGGGEDVAGWSAVNGCGAVLAFLDLKEGLKTLVENYVMGEGRVGREEVEELLVCSESCSMLKDLEPSGYELSFVELAREGGDKERYKAFKAAVFAELASKVACLRLQLKSVVRGENIDVDKIGDIGDVGGLVLKQLEEEEGGMVDTTGKMGLELSALRVIASYLVAKF